MADRLLSEFEAHATTLAAKVRIDLVFAFPDYDETTGEPINDALTHGGVKALGVTRKTSLKDRAKGLGDAEICLDGEWWKSADEPEQRALLDHELHHLVATDKRDNLGRPIIKLRKHDFDFGWFTVIAERHGLHSQECKQASYMMDAVGQYYWPALGISSAETKQPARMARIELTAA